jgi:hypothetical protein
MDVEMAFHVRYAIITICRILRIHLRSDATLFPRKNVREL